MYRIQIAYISCHVKFDYYKRRLFYSIILFNSFSGLLMERDRRISNFQISGQKSTSLRVGSQTLVIDTEETANKASPA